jgi:dipeptidyl aminopeptidase/acylaminoacyl peptidase
MRSSVRIACAALGLAPAPLSASGWATARSTSARILAPEDFAGMMDVSDPQLSADGGWLAYTVKSTDLEKDQRPAHIWVCRWNGSENRVMAAGGKSQSHPRWSPDGKWIAFLSTRDDGQDRRQIWLQPLAGGEAQKVTTASNGIEDFCWSPDSRQLAVIARDLDPRAAAARSAEHDKKSVPPLVIDRYYFKEDIAGYLNKAYAHLALLDLASRRLSKLTHGDFDDAAPAWAPDGQTVAFVSKRGDDPDRTENWQIYLIAPRPGAKERPLTVGPEASAHPDWDGAPSWSPDGQSLAFVRQGPPEKIEYAAHPLATISATGEHFLVLYPELDRNVFRQQWTRDGLYALVENDGAQTLMEFSAGGAAPRPVVGGRVTITRVSAAGGHLAVLLSTPDRPFEIFAAENGVLRPLSRQNDAWVKPFRFGETREIHFPSKDRTDVHGFIVFAGEARPPGAKSGPRPTLLRLHGGPQSQHQAQFNFEAQLFASHGYNVLLPNPRGSTGRGTAYAMGIYAKWGSADVEDDLAAVDYAVAQGWADPARLGVGGWSYGGLASNYLIASTPRFKAATAGASPGNVLSGFGTNEYIRDYEVELGPPWKNPAAWLNISYPFFHADRIHTPTLFLAGQSDFNVPLLHSEQMYQALRQLRVPTELIIYPGQFHVLTKPSYILDRYQRYLAWYARWIPQDQPRR